VIGSWRKLHNEELRNLYFLPKYYWGDQIKENGMGGAYEGKRLLGRPRNRWEDNNRMDLKEIGGEVQFRAVLNTSLIKAWAFLN
jgi:hypothetical protein